MELNIKNHDLELLGGVDKIFQENFYPKPFEFDGQVAEVFDNMVSRSVPLYKEVIQTLICWAVALKQDDAIIYDVGCSTGTAILALSEAIEKPSKFIGIDNSNAMIAKAEKKLEKMPSRHKLELLCADVSKVGFDKASLVVMNYTLQFISVSSRFAILKKIADGLRPGGLLFLSEKIRSPNPQFQEITTLIYENFKRRNGYSKSEIERKKEALDQVLVPFTLKEMLTMLEKCGFTYAEPIIQWNNFVTIIAQKEI